MIAGLLGANAGLGVWLIVTGLMRNPRPLPELAEHVRRDTTADGGTDRWQRAATALLRGRTTGTAADLAVTERATGSQASACLQSAVLLAAVPPAAWALLGAAGIHVPAPLAIGASLAAGPFGWWAASRLLKATAATARRDFDHALATYLDLVVALLVGGAGIDTALDDASRLGTGSAYRLLRAALRSAQERREPPWRALGDLGDRVAVTGLSELAASMTLAGEHGARVKSSLIAKAAGLRARELARSEADAARASEAMTLPVVLMGFGFVLLICYPPLIGLTHV